MGGAVCSAIVSELLKMRKSLAIHYWWDVPSDVELNNNVINVKKIWGVWTSFVICTIFRFNTIFSIYEKKNLAKIWEGGGVVELNPLSLPRFLRACLFY